MPNAADAPQAGQLGHGTMLSYCLYAIPLTATTAAITNFIPPYYSEVFGLPLATVGAGLLMIRIIDAVMDPLIGWAVDAAPFRQQHRPWLLIALPVYLASVGLLFFPPPGWVGQAYLVAVGGAAYVAFTLGVVAHQAWGASLARDPPSLSRLFGYREVAVIVGILGVFGLAALAESWDGAGVGAKAAAAGGFVLAAVVVCSLTTYVFTPDPPAVDVHNGADLAAMRPFLLGADFIKICLATLAYNFSWVAYSVLGYFVAKHIFGAGDRFALGLTLSFVIAPLGMAVWMQLARKIGDQRTLIAACFYLAAVFAALPLLRGAPGGYFLFTGLLGIGFGAGPYLLRSLTGVLANRFEAQAGVKVRGAAYAGANFFDKAGSGLGSVALLLVSTLGFRPELNQVAGPALQALLITAVAAPALGFLIAAAAVWRMQIAPHRAAADKLASAT